MRPVEWNRPARTWRKFTGLFVASVLALSVFGGTVQAANSRIFGVTVGTPTAVSQGGATKFDVTVQSGDNQTIANVVLRIPAAGQALPAGITIMSVFGANASMCAASDGTSLSCVFGNISASGTRAISVLAGVSNLVPPGDSTVISASAETNNENGSNQQVETGSASLHVILFSANAVSTFNLGGQASTSDLGTFDAGNLKTTLNLIETNGGNGNAVVIAEGTNATQPAYCVALKLTCQPDFTDLTVNAGAAVSPYLETILTAKVPKTYNIRKAFVIHVLSDGVTVETGFPLYNAAATSCVTHPALVPCADFSLTKTNVLTIVVHTTGNGKMSY